MNILNDLYNGKIYPLETIVPSSLEYQNALGKASEFQSALEADLTDSQLIQFKSYIDFKNLANSILMSETFQSGFKTGAKIILEVFVNSTVMLDNKERVTPT